jgi:hypothetical protein
MARILKKVLKITFFAKAVLAPGTDAFLSILKKVIYYKTTFGPYLNFRNPPVQQFLMVSLPELDNRKRY